MPHRLPTRAATMAAAAAAFTVAGATQSRAQITTIGNLEYSTSLSSLPSNSDVSTVYLGTSSTSGLVSNATITEGTGSEAATISFSGTSGIYNGNVKGVAAAPYTPSGVQTTNFFAAEPQGAVTISYASQQQYFGMLWGSVDTYNTLSFYNGSSLVGQLTGSNVKTNANGDQGANGSYFVNINFSGVTYNSVVAQASSPAFEFGLISASQTQQVIVAPAPLGLPGATPAGLAVLAAGAGLRFWRRAAPGIARPAA